MKNRTTSRLEVEERYKGCKFFSQYYKNEYKPWFKNKEDQER